MTHAFFKALLFLAAGIVINAMDDEHNIFHMGGLRTRLPFAFWVFVIEGMFSLAGLPLVTAGAVSKDWIIWGAWSGANGSPEIWMVGLIGVLLTSLYTFRMIFVVFFGEAHKEVTKGPGYAMRIAVVFVLALLTLVAGYFKAPFGRFLEQRCPGTTGRARFRSASLLLRGNRRVSVFAGIISGLHLVLAQARIRSRVSV